LRLFKELRDNPQQALKNLLTRAATNGINTSEFAQPGSFDPKSLMDVIRQEIGQAVNPLKERTEAERKQAQEAQQRQQAQDQVNQQVSSFFDANPDAKAYIPVFTNAIKQFPDMSLGEVWARIQLQLSRNPPSSGGQAPQNSPRRSLPSGRPAPMNGSGGDLAPVTDSYEAIVRAAMSSAGIR
jgi:hypothetical protein